LIEAWLSLKKSKKLYGVHAQAYTNTPRHAIAILMTDIRKIIIKTKKSENLELAPRGDVNTKYHTTLPTHLITVVCNSGKRTASDSDLEDALTNRKRAKTTQIQLEEMGFVKPASQETAISTTGDKPTNETLYHVDVELNNNNNNATGPVASQQPPPQPEAAPTQDVQDKAQTAPEAAKADEMQEETDNLDDFDLDVALEEIQATTIVLPRKDIPLVTLEDFKQACEKLAGFQFAWSNDSSTAFHARFNHSRDADAAKPILAKAWALSEQYSYKNFQPEDELRAILHVGDKDTRPNAEQARRAVIDWIKTLHPDHEAATKTWLDPNKKGTVFYVAGMGAALHTKFVNRASIIIDGRSYGITACTIGYFELQGFDNIFPATEKGARGILKKMEIDYNGPVVIKRSREKEAPIAAYVLLELPRGNREAKQSTIQEYEKKILRHEFKSNRRKYEFKLAFSRARGKKKPTKPKANRKPVEPTKLGYWERVIREEAEAANNAEQSRQSSRSHSRQSSRVQSRASSPRRSDDYDKGEDAPE
jgi:hypothetical protein